VTLKRKQRIGNIPSHQTGDCPQKQFSYYHKGERYPL